MLRTILFILSLIISIPLFAEPVNLTEIKQQLISYHDSGEYNRELANVVKEAMYYLQFRVIQNERSEHPKKLAMVLAVDETALSNYKDIVSLNFGGTKEEIDRLENEAKDPAISPVNTLYRYAKKNHIDLFFVTSRPIAMKKATIANLKEEGYTGWKTIYFVTSSYKKNKSMADFKIAMRKKILDEGYDILLNLGSQYSDLKGGNADMDFKLPNPYYSVV